MGRKTEREVIDAMRIGPGEQPGHPVTELLKTQMEKHAKARLREKVMKEMSVSWREKKHGTMTTELQLTVRLQTLAPGELQALLQAEYERGCEAGRIQATSNITAYLGDMVREAVKL